MATNAVLFPSLYPSIFSPVDGLFLAGGKIFFFDEDKTTPKNVYQEPDAATPYANPFTLDSIASLPVFYGLNDGKPYWVKIYAAPDPGCDCLEDDPIHETFVYLNSSGSISSEQQIENLLPSYGFDSKVFADYYAADGIPLSSGRNIHYFSQGLYFDITTTDLTQKLTYEFSELDNSQIIGNPKNSIIIACDNASGGDTNKQIRIRIGYYNSFQGIQLGLQVRTKLINGALSTIPVKLIRTKQHVDEIAQDVGELQIALAAQLSAIYFTPDNLTGTGYANDDELYLCFDLPLNNSFKIELTATWLQESPTQEVNISEQNYYLETVKQFFGGMALGTQIQNPEDHYGFPVVQSAGDADYLRQTGRIFLGSASYHYNFAYKMRSKGIFKVGSIYDKTVPHNRVIKYLVDSGITNSTNTLMPLAKTSTTLDVSTGLACKPKSDWQSFGSNIVLSDITEQFEMGLIATPEFTTNLTGKITFTFVDNGVVNSGFYDPPTSSGSFPGAGHFDDHSLYITNYLGYFEEDLSSNEVYFRQYLKNTNISAGSASEQAVCAIRFGEHEAPIVKFGTASGNYPVYLTARSELLQDYLKSLNVKYRYDITTERDYKTGFLTWNKPGDAYTNTNTQKYVLGFNVDGDGAPNVPAEQSGGIKKVIDVSRYESNNSVIKKIVSTINNPFVKRFTFNGIPPSGDTDKTYISTENDDLVLIPWNTSTTAYRPTNPDPGRHPVYYKYTSSTTIAELIDIVEESIKYAVAGIPLPDDLYLEDHTDENLDYYMFL